MNMMQGAKSIKKIKTLSIVDENLERWVLKRVRPPTLSVLHMK